ncbi:siderophore-interacting protein [Streptomyces sp. S3(2020)]|uniref:siderophore-interacting protein n=1 Tax=Streptomyces sp. S3(2020) TaxID=2732044 RepID=UPI0019D0FA25|nr:siderophore-interacting protein [Streptomyces sp. S3(2020)]
MPKTSRRLTAHPMNLREVEVVRVVDLTPGMRPITLSGEQLFECTSANGFPQSAFDSPGFNDDIRLMFRHPGRAEPVQRENGVDLPRNPQPLSKVSTVRRWDPEAGELGADLVRHGVGVGTTWAYRAQVGDRIYFYGPSLSRALRHDTHWLLVAGDDTAIPAIARILDELPDNARAQVFVEVAGDAHRLELRALPHIEVTWLVRDGAGAGTTSLLRDAVGNTNWWVGRPFAWAAGEHTAVRDLRRHLVEDREVPQEDIEFTGYWRRGKGVALEPDEAVPAPETSITPFEKRHELTALIRLIAIRTAVELGAPALISRGVTGVADLAGRTESQDRALGKPLRHLHAVGILTETEPDHYGLTAVGEVLTNEFVVDTLHPVGVAGRETLGIHGLTESIHTGRPSYASVTGQTFADVRAEQRYEDRCLERLAKFQSTPTVSIAKSEPLAGVRHLVIHSGGVIQPSVFKPSPASDTVFISRTLSPTRPRRRPRPGQARRRSRPARHHRAQLPPAHRSRTRLGGLVRTTTHTVAWGTTAHELVPVGTH